MNILQEYTIEYLKKNKRNSIGIIISIFIATILISMFVMHVQSSRNYNIVTIKNISGNWHGELFADTKGEYLDVVKNDASVESIMVKGNWYTSKFSDNDKRPYLILRDLDANYWSDMSEKNSILEGHYAQAPNEIVVSKQLVDEHPEIQVGTVLPLEIGSRTIDGVSVDPRETLNSNEIFVSEKTSDFVVVGIFDAITSSIMPGYIAYGYLDHANVLADDNLTIYMRMNNPKNIFSELPRIAELAGHKKNEYGEYILKYNYNLLGNEFLTFPPDDDNVVKGKTVTSFILYGTALATIIGLFVFIIKGAFYISIQNRIKQIGMFKSVGATPKQIRQSVTFEALILTIIPLPFAFIVSYLLYSNFIKINNDITKQIFEQNFDTSYYHSIEVIFNFTTILLCILFVWITVWISAYLPAKKVSRLLPISLIKNHTLKTNYKKRKKSYKSISTELVRNGFWYNKKNFRTTIITLTLSIAIVGTYIFMFGSSDILSELRMQETIDYTIKLTISDGRDMETEIFDAINNNNLIESSVTTNLFKGTTLISDAQTSSEIQNKGGLSAITATNSSVLKQDDKYRISTELWALDDESFNQYCISLGLNPQDFYDIENFQTILYNQIPDVALEGMHIQSEKTIPFLNVNLGDKIEVSTNVIEETDIPKKVITYIGAIADKLPINAMNNSNIYKTLQIVPSSIYKQILIAIDDNEVSGYKKSTAYIVTKPENVSTFCNELNQICKKHYIEGDYNLWDIDSFMALNEENNKSSMMMMYGIVGAFALVGISNAFISIYTSLRSRRRDFAMLRSVGIDKQQLNKLLIDEAIYFSILPIIFSVPIFILPWLATLYLQGALSDILQILPQLNYIPFIFSIVTTAGSVLMAYFIASQNIRKDKIIETIKDETI
ncbi:hypothetical protein AN639_02575 [Candidatus Epulonipiscium fishelsonii]|uniref:Uncharacterized protein n=1 Tax=Candidatus Epulonipiscium fishelsonii TaxID=77094 RepID=A0ACC8X9V2_9FIRM|nr:hypothetical protein AN396_09460 [Epulopiscium sp. SCG-B11WGA-EpuloA1]ONI42011.1 hypothetical protein AN639_02575 [Epulopiscium sp. SCG-B05WGA-EpuloA1]